MKTALRTAFVLLCAAVLFVAAAAVAPNAFAARARGSHATNAHGAAAAATQKAKSTKHKKTKKAKTASQSGSKLGTDFSFGAAAINGKYQYAAEGVVTVEDEKELTDLLGVRRHFKDRLAEETTRQ